LRADRSAGEDGFEACDDGNEADDDACLGNCVAARCGDRIVRLDVGAGSADPCGDDDGCQGGEVCTTGLCRPPGFEACEDGNRRTNDACVHCQIGRCGDGFVRRGEEACDDGAANSDDRANACRRDCTEARCGDGVIDDNETCDDGEANSDETPNACRASTCTPARCGDAVVDDGEACDDANEVETDACRNDCVAARCGDGLQRLDLGAGEAGFEACDDGNVDDGDWCSPDCAIVPLGIFAGIRGGFPDAALAGWNQCHSQDFAAQGTPQAYIRRQIPACQGTFLLLVCRRDGAAMIHAAASAETASALAITGVAGASVNDSTWYFSPTLSWGFAPAGASIDRAPCDGAEPGAEDRLCIPTAVRNNQDQFLPGGRCGRHQFGAGEGRDWIWTVYYRDG
jgi:cysteine-rich repeat protein